MRILALTLDDGLVMQFLIAKLLANLGIRATLFLIAGLKQYNGKETLIANPELTRAQGRGIT